MLFPEFSGSNRAVLPALNGGELLSGKRDFFPESLLVRHRPNPLYSVRESRHPPATVFPAGRHRICKNRCGSVPAEIFSFFFSEAVRISCADTAEDGRENRNRECGERSRAASGRGDLRELHTNFMGRSPLRRERRKFPPSRVGSGRLHGQTTKALLVFFLSYLLPTSFCHSPTGNANGFPEFSAVLFSCPGTFLARMRPKCNLRMCGQAG